MRKRIWRLNERTESERRSDRNVHCKIRFNLGYTKLEKRFDIGYAMGYGAPVHFSDCVYLLLQATLFQSIISRNLIPSINLSPIKRLWTNELITACRLDASNWGPRVVPHRLLSVTPVEYGPTPRFLSTPLCDFLHVGGPLPLFLSIRQIGK